MDFDYYILPENSKKPIKVIMEGRVTQTTYLPLKDLDSNLVRQVLESVQKIDLKGDYYD